MGAQLSINSPGEGRVGRGRLSGLDGSSEVLWSHTPGLQMRI